MKQKWIKKLIRQRFAAILILVFQVAFFFWFVISGTRYFPYLAVVLFGLSFLVLLHIEAAALKVRLSLRGRTCSVLCRCSAGSSILSRRFSLR